MIINYLFLFWFSNVCLAHCVFGFFVHAVNLNFSFLFKFIDVVHNSLIGLGVSMLQINYNLLHIDSSLIISIFKEHGFNLIKNLLFIMRNHPVDNFVLLFLHKISNSPPSESQFATISIVSLIIVVHYFFGFVFCNILNVYHLCFLKFVNFDKFAQNLIFYNDFSS